MNLLLPALSIERVCSAPLIAVEMSSNAVDHLKAQVWADFTNVLLNGHRLPFSANNLLEVDSLLPTEVCNVVMTPAQSVMLANYAGYYYQQAVRNGQDNLAVMLGELLDKILPGTTIRFQL